MGTLLEEANKCILVCANCHHEIHHGLDQRKKEKILENPKTHHEKEKKKALLRKIKLIEMKGDQCSRCFYDKNLSSLEFHHKDEKGFGLSRTNLTKSWGKISKEIKKCELLCSNCHREEHFPQYKNNGA